MQRRHQKLIEESPSPFLTPDLRKKMGKASVRAAEAAEYAGGTAPSSSSWMPPMHSAVAYSRTRQPDAARMSTFLEQTEAVIATWFGVAPPNDPARRLAAELADTIAAFEKLRGTLVFEDEPASFEAALAGDEGDRGMSDLADLR